VATPVAACVGSAITSIAANRLVSPERSASSSDARTVDLERGLELADAPLRRAQLVPLGRRKPRLETTINAVLTTPAIDRLLADGEVARDVGDLAARLKKIEDAAT
jgi:hypothetical protein